MLLTTLWIGLAGALLMFAGDMLLYYTPEDFACGPKSSAGERINAIIDVMKELPAGRVMAGGMIGPIAAFLYCIGFYHIVLMTNEQTYTLAMAAFLLSCFGIIIGGAYHSHCAYLGLLGDDGGRNALNAAMKYFQKMPLILYAGEGIGFLLLIFLIVTGKTVLPRWIFLLSPGMLFLLKPAVSRLPKGARVIISGGWMNLISVIYYSAVLIAILI
ncbi:MAG: hypothetical protein IIY45_12145 [Firmicutes bacterium]|jgi:hypothetical protein|nr:hypothetical protein [Bacillota bacterium]